MRYISMLISRSFLRTKAEVLLIGSKLYIESFSFSLKLVFFYWIEEISLEKNPLFAFILRMAKQHAVHFKTFKRHALSRTIT